MTHTLRADQALDLAVKFHQMGRLGEAEENYRHALGIESGNVTALHLLGVLRYQQARYQEALDLIGAALGANPRLADAWANYGLVLQAMGQLRELLEACDNALRLAPGNPGILSNRGNLLLALGRPTDALADHDKALGLDPRNIAALVNRGNALRTLARLNEAIDNFDRALTLAPDHPDLWNGRGAALRDLGRYAEALESVDRALKVRPRFAQALSNRGATLQDLGRHEEALESFQAAIAQNPDDPTFLNNIGALLHKECRFSEALIHFEAVLKLAPNDVAALYHRGAALQSLGRLAEAALSFDKVLAQNPDHPHAFAALATVIIRACDWERATEIGKLLPSQIDKGASIPPLTLLAYGLDAEHQLSAARTFVAKSTPDGPLFQPRVPRRSDRIRVAYLSSDFHAHATAYLTAEIFERHDRSRFDIMGISYGPDDGSATRHRLKQAFGGQFHDVRRRTDSEIAQLLFDTHVDIAVDLKGLTQDARPGILASRPAPVCVNYLGYPSTMAMSAIDYVIADSVTLPFADQAFYSEKIVHLPVAYQPRDTMLAMPEARSSRADFGLPQDGLVFCCFNNSWKIGPALFDIWMRLLQSVQGSVFWLLEDNADAKHNLQKAARSRGVDPARLVFSTRVPLPQHLERHVHADLFLDSLPYNAHTTASDALWAGVPLLTCRGETFAGRVAASLLTTLGLPELVTDNLGDYETLARSLAMDPDLLGEIRKKFAFGRDNSPLFKMDQFTRHLEAAYDRMIEIAAAGEKPRGFAVPADHR